MLIGHFNEGLGLKSTTVYGPDVLHKRPTSNTKHREVFLCLDKTAVINILKVTAFLRVFYK